MDLNLVLKGIELRLVPLSNPITVEHEAHIVILIASYSEVIGWTQ